MILSLVLILAVYVRYFNIKIIFPYFGRVGNGQLLQPSRSEFECRWYMRLWDGSSDGLISLEDDQLAVYIR